MANDEQSKPKDRAAYSSAGPFEGDDRSPAVQAYSQVMSRVEKVVADAEVRGWEGLREEINKAVEFEQGVADLSKNEWELIKTYLKRDLSALVSFVSETGKGVADWLRQDVEVIEDRVLKSLLTIADKTQLEQAALEQRLHHDSSTYIAGEVACAGTLRCLSCGKMVCLVETAHIESCHACGNQHFQRVTSRWPSKPEVDGTA